MNETKSPNVVVFFRDLLEFEQEMLAASKYFNVVSNRTLVKNNDLVIGRYSVLPFYKETEKDIQILGGTLINSYQQHKFIADFEYYELLKEFTPETWTDEDFYRCEYQGPFVVKGKTNSRKHEWNGKMFVENKREASLLAGELAKDSLIGPQGILYRKYVPLKTYDVGINGIRFTNEWRFFFLGNHLLDFGYYWSSYKNISKTECPETVFSKAMEVAKIVKEWVNFFVIDVAETEDGKAIMIEMNDGQMSGLSEIEPENFYRNLKSQTKD
jgi:hypothetical protein